MLCVALKKKGEPSTTHESLHACVYIILCAGMTHERRARLVVMLKAASQESEAHFANRTARTNKVQGHFCRREWFGESKVDVRAFLDVYV